MASQIPGPVIQRGNKVTLCDCLKEILEVLWCHFQNEEQELEGALQKMTISILVKKKSQESEDSSDVFTFTDLDTSNLCQFTSYMQTHQQESHLIICTLDNEDPVITKKFVLWVSSEDEKGLWLKVNEEIVMNRSPLMEDAFLLQLRVFMKSSMMSKEIHSISNLLCCVKMLNPEVDIRLSVDGFHNVDLHLSNVEYFHCGSLTFSADPTVYHFGNLSGVDDDAQCVPDMSNLTCVHVNSKNSSKTSGEECDTSQTLSSLIFVPTQFDNNHRQEERVATVEKHGTIFIQVFDSKKLPIDMLQFGRCFGAPADSLIPWEKLKAIKKSHGRCTPYNTGCRVSTISQAQLPHSVKACDKFTLWLCLVLHPEISDLSAANSSDVLDVLKNTVQESFDKFFQPDVEDIITGPSKNISNNQDHQIIKRWIPDIADCLSEIYIKSTCVDFRTQLAQMIPLHNSAGLKSILNDKLTQILVPKEFPFLVQQPLDQSIEMTVEEEIWTDFAPTEKSEGSMSPDSLELMDQDWQEMREKMDITDQHLDLKTSHCFASEVFDWTAQGSLMPNHIHPERSNLIEARTTENFNSLHPSSNGIDERIRGNISNETTKSNRESDTELSKTDFLLQHFDASFYGEDWGAYERLTDKPDGFSCCRQELPSHHLAKEENSYFVETEFSPSPDKPCDDWYDRAEFDKWCAEMLQ